MTELEIISSVLELVTSAEGVTNTSLSREQVGDELDTLRVRMIMEIDARSNFRRPYQGYTQTISNLQIQRDSNRNPYVIVPRITIQLSGEPACLYIGGRDDKSGYHFVTGGDIDNVVHEQFTGRMPIACYNDGRITFKNVSPQYIKIVAVFEDPSDLEVYGDYDSESSEYPFPAGLIDSLIGKTAESYIRTMYRVRPQANTQTDLAGAGPSAK